jgi:hypothetical protein
MRLRRIFFLWRTVLRDPKDEFVLELAARLRSHDPFLAAREVSRPSQRWPDIALRFTCAVSMFLAQSIIASELRFILYDDFESATPISYGAARI